MNFYTINRGIVKRLHSYFSYQSRKIQYRTHIKKLIKESNCKPLTQSQILETKKYYASFGFKNISTDWHRIFTHWYGKFYKEYIPEDLFFNVIEQHLNMVEEYIGLTDKSLQDKIFTKAKQPKTVIKNINGYFFNGNNEILDHSDALELCNKFLKLIIKPTIDSGGGKNIIVFHIENGKTNHKNLSLKQLFKLYDKNFIIQELIIQHKKMGLLNATSVNTIRTKSLLINNKIEILTSLVRIGSKGSYVDNTSSGGIYCHVDKEGFLNEKGYFGNGKHVFETDSKIILKNFEIPHFHDVLSLIKGLHFQVPQFRMISWDFAIDKNDDLVLIEYNVRGQGMDGQGTYGPLFGQFTDEILGECKVDKFSKLNIYS